VEAPVPDVSCRVDAPALFESQSGLEHERQEALKRCDSTARIATSPRGHRSRDLRSTYATRLSAGGVADEWVTQLLRQSDAEVFKKYSQMELQMKRDALQKLNRAANESAEVLGQAG
jgi:hypothetical protein